MTQKSKRAKLSSAILDLDQAIAPSKPSAAPSADPAPSERGGGHGIVATALDLHREGLKERLDALERETAEARARGDWLDEISPALIDDNLPADRDLRFRDGDALDELTRSIDAHGQHVPILVRRHPSQPGRFEVAAGRRRLEACRRLQRPILARVLPLDDGAMLDLQYRENAERADVSLFERSRWFLAVQASTQASTTALAKRFELSQPMMVEYLKLARLPETVTAELDDPRELTIAQSRKLHTLFASSKDAEQRLVTLLKSGGKGQGTATQLKRALASLNEPGAVPTGPRKQAQPVTDTHGKTLFTVTQSGRQSVFRFAPDIDPDIVAGLARELPALIAKLREPTAD